MAIVGKQLRRNSLFEKHDWFSDGEEAGAEESENGRRGPEDEGEVEEAAEEWEAGPPEVGIADPRFRSGDHSAGIVDGADDEEDGGESPGESGEEEDMIGSTIQGSSKAGGPTMPQGEPTMPTMPSAGEPRPNERSRRKVRTKPSSGKFPPPQHVERDPFFHISLLEKVEFGNANDQISKLFGRFFKVLGNLMVNGAPAVAPVIQLLMNIGVEAGCLRVPQTSDKPHTNQSQTTHKPYTRNQKGIRDPPCAD